MKSKYTKKCKFERQILSAEKRCKFGEQRKSWNTKCKHKMQTWNANIKAMETHVRSHQHVQRTLICLFFVCNSCTQAHLTELISQDIVFFSIETLFSKLGIHQHYKSCHQAVNKLQLSTNTESLQSYSLHRYNSRASPI